MDYVLTENALGVLLPETTVGVDDADILSVIDVARVSGDGVCFLMHQDDAAGVRRVFFMADVISVVLEQTPEVRHQVWDRARHFVALTGQPKIRLPATWGSYQVGNRLAFYASHSRKSTLRWFAEVNPSGTKDVIFWRLFGSRTVRLEEFLPPRGRHAVIASAWEGALSRGHNHLEGRVKTDGNCDIAVSVDLVAATFGAVTQYHTYNWWKERLTGRQLEFFNHQTDCSVKLKGPAGSGKTLVLQLKALDVLYHAKDSGLPVRILYCTHSWALTEDADRSLRSLDEGGDISCIDVLPLLSLAHILIGSERSEGGVRILGKDNLDGKWQQLMLLDELLANLVSGQWIAWKSMVSGLLRDRVESPRGTPAWNALVYDVMMEFTCVLYAAGILPGVLAEKKYLKLRRTPWMMPLGNDVDKRFILLIYSAFVESLASDGYLSSDQVINDLLGYLEGFSWNVKRRDWGYDFIFVDELHLFNAQERLALNFLGRPAGQFPRMFMALDPRQSPAEVFVSFPVGPVSEGDTSAADVGLGDVDKVELQVVYRFTPEILKLVRHIHNQYPALGLGEDWKFDAAAMKAERQSGSVPTLTVHESWRREMDGLVHSAGALNLVRGKPSRTAIVLLEAQRLGSLVEWIGDDAKGFSVVDSREALVQLAHRRRSIVVTAAEFVLGLQFDNIVVGGLPGVAVGGAGYALRRFLSLLYVGISRATSTVAIHVNAESEGIPEVIRTAVDQGVLIEVSPVYPPKIEAQAV